MPAILEYCTADDLDTIGLGSRALSKMTATEKTAAIKAASSLIDSYLRNQYTLPLARVGEDLKQCCAILACYGLLRTRGFDPAADGNEVIVTERDNQTRWLESIAKGSTAPDITDSSPESYKFGAGPRVITSTPRGYVNRSGTRGAFTRD
jgi:phage gp36-like protein